MYTIIRTDGSEETVNEVPTIEGIREAIHCDTLDVVQIGRANGTDEIILVDDTGAHTDKPVNEKATKLYHRICKPGTTWQIRGDAVVTRDRYFEWGQPDEKHFTADQLIAWRKGHGWTQAEAAARILLSLDGYRKKEQGRSSTNKRDMKLIELADQEESEKKATA